MALIHKRFTEDSEYEGEGDETVAVKDGKAHEESKGTPTSNTTTKMSRQKLGSAISKPASNSRKKGKKAISSHIRGLERLLRKPNLKLNERKRKAKETELEELKRMVQERGRRTNELKSSQRYHKIRFFERRKLERALEKESDENKRKALLDDLFYVQHFPKGRKYIALFPKGGLTDQSRRQIEEIRKAIGQPQQQQQQQQQLANEVEGETEQEENSKEGSEGSGEDVDVNGDGDDFFL